MKTHEVFKKGQIVTICGRGQNASQFNKSEKCNISGVYSLENWKDKKFEIEGTVKLITYHYTDNIYGAYLLKYNGVKIGYVYNTGIRSIE